MYFCTRFRINRHRGRSRSDLFVFLYHIEPADAEGESAFDGPAPNFFHYPDESFPLGESFDTLRQVGICLAAAGDAAAEPRDDTLGVEVSKYDPFMSHEGVIARTIMYREQLKDLIKKYPDAVCINLGCGFDDKFSQVDNGTIQWFDVDLPDQIAVRRKVYEDRERCKMLDGNALDGSWTRNIPDAGMYIIVMEGVLEYFSKEQVKTCLNMLCDSFPHGYLLAELHCPFMEKNSKHHDAVKYTNASFGWGTNSGKEYLELEPRLTLISETSYNEEMKKYSIRGKLFAIIGKKINNRLAVYRW